jgi:alpha-glucosidase
MSSLSRRDFIINAQAALITTALAPTTEAQPRITLSSPGGNLSVTIAVDQGRLNYSVTEGRIEVLMPSPLGLSVDGVDLGREAKLAGRPTTRDIHETYNILGNHAHARDFAKEINIPMEASGNHFALVVRAYDDGVAVRYLLPEGAKRIDGDATGWQLPDHVEKTVWANYDPVYEGLSHATALSELPENKPVMGPVLVKTAHHYLSLSEADCENFSDMSIAREGNLLRANLSLEPKGWDIQASITDAREDVLHGRYLGRSATPWRSTVIVRDLTALINSDLLTNLCPPPAHGTDFAWVKPGRSLWSWWSVDDPPYVEIKDWYDAAAKLKWEYYLIDAGWIKWSSPGKDCWAMLKDASDYGKSVGVRSIVWGQYSEMPSPAARRKWLENAKASGVAGVKLDFPPKGTASAMNWWYLGTLRDCAELKLLVDFHGAVKPAGLQRTYPNGLTREAVRGNEYNISRYKRIQPYTEDVTLPFGRPLAGPADITPVILNPKELSPSHFTWAHQLAQSVVYLSPITVFCDHYKYYLESPVRDLLEIIPSVWDETRVLACTEIGEVVAYARRKGDTWWVGIINGSTQREIHLSFDFLNKPGMATLITDDASVDAAVKRQQRRVNHADTLTIQLRPGGGFFARLAAAAGSVG